MQRNRAAQDVIVDFLTERLQYFTDWLRSDVRSTLIELGNPYSGNFIDGWSANVVSMQSMKGPGEAARKRAVAKAKKAQRSAEDAALRARMRGDHGGQKKK